VGVDESKRNKTDFVLWFTKSKFEDQELKWESPWGLGYPGWHIECSAISMRELGDRLDIHCGGIDNAFPHHTNEIAQSEAYCGHKWCNFWFHVHHLVTDSGKMSKSSGEFLTVSLLQEKGYDPLAYRLFCLQSHYRKALMFSWDALDNAVVAYDKLVSRIAAVPADGEADPAEMQKYKDAFGEALGNDLNTSLALTALYDVLKADISGASKRALIADFDTVLGLDLLEKADAAPAGEDGEDAEIDALVAARTAARAAKNWAESDRLRDEIAAAGWAVKDSKDGQSVTKK
jgi:cysteinyl-tRNA synthetase